MNYKNTDGFKMTHSVGDNRYNKEKPVFRNFLREVEDFVLKRPLKALEVENMRLSIKAYEKGLPLHTLVGLMCRK